MTRNTSTNSRAVVALASTAKCRALGMILAFALAGTAQAIDPLEAYLNNVRLNELLAKGLDGTGIDIGLIESGGPNTTHVGLAGATITVRAGGTTTDHATRTAALLVGQRTPQGGNFQGVANKAHLWSSGISTAPAGTAVARTKNIVDWQLAAPRTSVINVSWGAYDWNQGTAAERTAVRRIFDRAASLGQTYVAAAGNEGDQAGDGGNNTGNLTNPGYAYNVITVGATGPFDSWNRVENYSSVTQANAAGTPTARLKVDLVAPGAEIKSAAGTAAGNTTFSNANGTSFATPIVTGTVALLQQHGRAKGFSTDPRLMRAVLMNSANKTVENRAGVRWDQEFKANAQGVAATRTSHESGAGKLDAMQAYEQYNAGRSRAYTKNANPFPGSEFAKTTGWDVDKAANGIGNIYVTAETLRKGTYMTSTLTWHRDVDSTDADPANWTYKDLDQLDLTVREYLTPGGQVSTSNFGGNDANLNGTSQHNVLKLSRRNQYLLNVSYRATSPLNDSVYALAWRSYAMDTHNVKEFNGDFSGDRGAYRDNGWFQAHNAVTFGQAVRRNWMPGTADNWAFQMTSGIGIPAGLAQEVVRPLSFFVVTFDIAFESLSFSSSVQVFLGNLLLGTVFAEAANVQQFQFISSFALDANQLAGLAPGAFVDLSFKFSSSDVNGVYIDNVTYIPNGSSVALLALGMALGVRRRR